MKKTMLMIGLTMASVGAVADDGLLVAKSDGSSVNVAVADISCIRFADGAMVINTKAGEKQMIALDEVSNIVFGDMPTAIRAIVGDTNKEVTITDMSGRVVYRGAGQSDMLPSSLHGVFIVTADGQSRKVVIR